MNIRNGIDQLSQIFSTPTATPSGSSQPVDRSNENGLTTDRARLSSAASKVAASVSESDVRLQKVTSVQSAIQAGTYQVPASKVADSVIRALLNPES